MDPSAFGDPSGPPREAEIFQEPEENQCCLPSRLFASDGLLRPQDGPEMAQDGPKIVAGDWCNQMQIQSINFANSLLTIVSLDRTPHSLHLDTGVLPNNE